MTHVEKFKLKGKEYFRLVHNTKINGKVVHKTKYLGSEIPSTEKMKSIEQEFMKEINKEGTKYFSQEELDKIEAKKLSYVRELKKLSPIEKKNKLEEFMIRYTYDSSKLSGVEVTLRQTFLILKEGIIPNEFKNLRIAKEIENHEKGFMMITRYKDAFNLRFIKKLHELLMKGVNDEIAGKLRSELKRDVKIAGTSYVPPKWNELDKEIKNFFLWYKENSRKLHPLELASLIHVKLISMQMFVDGNSRLSRLLMNWVLWKKGYPLIDIPIEDLENYYNVLDYYQIEKKDKPFIEYILKRYLV
jgi:Fic family protein